MTSTSDWSWNPTIRARGGPTLDVEDWREYRRDFEPPESTRVVLVGVGASRTHYHRNDGHGRPACGRMPAKKSLDTWPIEKARTWRSPCSNPECYPEGDIDG